VGRLENWVLLHERQVLTVTIDGTEIKVRAGIIDVRVERVGPEQGVCHDGRK
jgi:hypothetical protein